MSTATAPIRPPTGHPAQGRIVERTTTITREIFLNGPAPAAARPVPAPSHVPEATDELLTTVSEKRLRGVNRALVRLGVWLIEAGRRQALRPSATADEIARRVDAAQAHDMRHFIGLPN